MCVLALAALSLAGQAQTPLPDTNQLQQIALEAAFNIMKSFSPDVPHKLFHQ
jgi:hypothetical protein